MSGFFRIHDGLPREGPGSRESTLRALGMVTDLGDSPLVLDVGSGPGPATVVLAEALPAARVIAVDLHAPFVAAVRSAAAGAEVGDRVMAVEGDMTALDHVLAELRVESVDLLWCEGAAYQMGTVEALTDWASLVRSGGALALTEPVWLAPTVSRVVKDFWDAAYPPMQPAAVWRARITGHPAWRRIGDFTLPASDWESYYAPIRDRVEELRPEAASDPSLDAAIAATDEELAVFDSGSATMVGYQFFVLRRV